MTYYIKQYAIKKSFLDIPNDRSSHTTATPRGGGLAIIIVFYIGLVYFKNELTTELFYALWCSLPIVIISLVDDIISVSSKIRLFIQSVSSVLALYFLGGVSSIDFLLFSISGLWVNIFAFIVIIWLTNLYNFLDGIDGYAGATSVTIGMGMFMFFNSSIGLVIVVTSLGFLIFNFPFKDKASIFMGDVGSATLGFIFAIFAFSDNANGNIYIWLTLLSLFFFDATITIIRRYKNGESITTAHKKHAYQRLNQSGWSHKKIVSYAFIFNILFLGLIYLIDNLIYVTLVNIILVYLINNYVDNKKAFV
ncbi:MAG: glycosyltransferase family 4 protein [Campylobacterota bacterium]|nr:glycosyltransferase family 4 protein [Campylobacterota bacterium]